MVPKEYPFPEDFPTGDGGPVYTPPVYIPRVNTPVYVPPTTTVDDDDSNTTTGTGIHDIFVQPEIQVILPPAPQFPVNTDQPVPTTDPVQIAPTVVPVTAKSKKNTYIIFGVSVLALLAAMVIIKKMSK